MTQPMTSRTQPSFQLGQNTAIGVLEPSSHNVTISMSAEQRLQKAQPLNYEWHCNESPVSVDVLVLKSYSTKL